MAAPKYTDRILAQEVRSLTLKKIKAVLESDEDKEFQKALLLRLAGSVLPRLNEHTGEDGSPINLVLSQAIAEKHGLSTPSAGTDSTGHPQV